MIKTQFIPLDRVDTEIKDIFQSIYKEKYEGRVPNGRIQLSMKITADDIRRDYTLGKIGADLAISFDLFQKRSTTVIGKMQNAELIGVILKDEY
jgi:hypothetical protein